MVSNSVIIIRFSMTSAWSFLGNGGRVIMTSIIVAISFSSFSRTWMTCD